MDQQEDAMRAVMREMGRRGAKARWAKLSDAERTEYARKIASMPRAKRKKTKAIKNIREK